MVSGQSGDSSLPEPASERKPERQDQTNTPELKRWSGDWMKTGNPPSVLARVNPGGTDIHPQAGMAKILRQVVESDNNN